MYWTDEGYLLSKNNFSENSIIIEAFTSNHGKYSGIVYGGSSRKQKRNFQIGNKILINFTSKGENRSGHFNIELIKAVSPFFFDSKKKSACILSAATLLRILLPERQLNIKIYNTFEKLLNDLKSKEWIKFYILWELSLIKDLGYETNSTYDKVKFNNATEIKKALSFNKSLLMKNFINPNKLNFPFYRNILERYYN